MVLDAVFKRIDRHLKREFAQPLIVDVQNALELQELKQHYNVGTNKFLSAQAYCKKDADPQLDRLYADLAQNEGVSFVTGLSILLKLQGEQKLKDSLRKLLALSTKGYVVIITYQCKKHLEFPDPRLQNRIIIADGEEVRRPSLIFISKNFPRQKDKTVLDGIDAISAIEEVGDDVVYVHTQRKRDSYPLSLLPIKDRTRAYDVLCDMDNATAQLLEGFGSEEQWAYALKQFDGKNDWAEVINANFGDPKTLQFSLPNFTHSTDERKWLYFIALKLFGCEGNWCIQTAALSASDVSNFIKQVYRCILSIDPDDKEFSERYEQRKQVLAQLGNPIDEVVDFCRVVHSKGKNAIYFVTENTPKEKEVIFELLDKYSEEYGKQKIKDILRLVYPDLAAYLAPYDFRIELLNSYFDDYKYQKVINKVLPEFEAIVEEQAKKREYNLLLQPRPTIVEKMDKKGAQLYFIDAMGVEYLSFIAFECQKLKLMLNVKIGRCELPSITSVNKEFLEYFEGGEHPIVSIKDIDEIKHHGKDDYDYQQTKLPIHLARELDIIKEVLEKIREKLISGTIDKAVIIADHGASRLAVIHETETVWEMPEKGKHSGRCCLKNEIDECPQFATDAGEFWALANYDRFKGSRKASVEVHGGATLEEVTVPIIELTYNAEKIEVRILPFYGARADFDAVPEIEVSFRKKAAVKLYISANVSDVSIRIDGKTYYAQATEQKNFFSVEMGDIKRPNTYYVDVFAGTNQIAERLPIKVKSEGMRVKGIL